LKNTTVKDVFGIAGAGESDGRSAIESGFSMKKVAK